jgi:hypothetical protein
MSRGEGRDEVENEKRPWDLRLVVMGMNKKESEVVVACREPGRKSCANHAILQPVQKMLELHFRQGVLSVDVIPKQQQPASLPPPSPSAPKPPFHPSSSNHSSPSPPSTAAKAVIHHHPILNHHPNPLVQQLVVDSSSSRLYSSLLMHVWIRKQRVETKARLRQRGSERAWGR